MLITKLLAILEQLSSEVQGTQHLIHLTSVIMLLRVFFTGFIHLDSLVEKQLFD